MTSPGYLSSARTDWQTPGPFLDLVRQVGPIALDPATAQDNPTGAALYYYDPTQAPTDKRQIGRCLAGGGLVGEWTALGLTFVNPPYGAHLSGPVDPDKPVYKKGVIAGVGTGWARRIAQHRGETIALVPNSTDSPWWHELAVWADLILLWRRRLAFVDAITGKPVRGNSKGSTVFYRALRDAGAVRQLDGCSRFKTAFSDRGFLSPGGAWRGGY